MSSRHVPEVSQPLDETDETHETRQIRELCTTQPGQNLLCSPVRTLIGWSNSPVGDANLEELEVDNKFHTPYL